MASNVKAVPEGYHTVTPNLSLRDAAKAIEFYQRAFGAREVSHFNMPDGKIGHAEIKMGDSTVMLVDETPQTGCRAPTSLNGTTVGFFLYVEDVDTTVQKTVRAGAAVTMPVADMFWGDRMGQVQDPFGHRWSVATHKADLSPAQIEQRGQECFASLPGGTNK